MKLGAPHPEQPARSFRVSQGPVRLEQKIPRPNEPSDRFCAGPFRAKQATTRLQVQMERLLFGSGRSFPAPVDVFFSPSHPNQGQECFFLSADECRVHDADLDWLWAVQRRLPEKGSDIVEGRRCLRFPRNFSTPPANTFSSLWHTQRYNR